VRTVLEFWMERTKNCKGSVVYVPHGEWGDLLDEMRSKYREPEPPGVMTYGLNGVVVRPYPPLPIRVWGEE
jgi:hypothetical protein